MGSSSSRSPTRAPAPSCQACQAAAAAAARRLPRRFHATVGAGAYSGVAAMASGTAFTAGCAVSSPTDRATSSPGGSVTGNLCHAHAHERRDVIRRHHRVGLRSLSSPRPMRRSAPRRRASDEHSCSMLQEHINRKLPFVVNVKSYGAKGDGSTDTAAIQAALNVFSGLFPDATCGILYFPQGSYIIVIAALHRQLHQDVRDAGRVRRCRPTWLAATCAGPGRQTGPSSRRAG